MVNLDILTPRQKALASARFQIIQNVPNIKIKQNGEFKNMYQNIYPYIKNLDIEEQISMAEWSLDKNLTNTLIKKLNLPFEMQNKYQNLLKENRNLNDTLNFRILNSKYNFLTEDLKYFVTDPDTEERLLSLDDEELLVFKFLYENITKITQNKYSYLDSFLKALGTTPFNLLANKVQKYQNLTHDLAQNIFSEKIDSSILNLLFYLYSSDLKYPLNTFDDVLNFNNQSILDEMPYSKSKLLLSSYGISLETAKSIDYKYDLTALPSTKIKQNIAQIKSIVNGNSIVDHTFNPLETLTLEENIKKEYAYAFNEAFYKPQGEYKTIEGIKIYEPTSDFYMLITALGAYQKDYQNPENYYESWFQNETRYHGIPCSLIAEDNLATAQVKNVILGFTDLNPSGLLLCGYNDLSSTEKAKTFNPSATKNSNFMTPSNLIDHTRSDHNEIVYDREDRERKTKVSPSYVYLEEYENIDDYFIKYQNDIDKFLTLQKEEQEEQKHLEETIKAAKDLHIPIVKINREKWAKKE